jgi:hypothetical protein
MTGNSWTYVRASDIFSEAAALIRRNLLLWAVGASAIFAATVGADLGVRAWLYTGPWAAILPSLLSFPIRETIVCLVIASLMRAERLAGRGWSPSAILPYFVAYFLATIATLFGFLLLIVPGVILMLRLPIFANLVIGQGLGPVEAMKASWKATRGSSGAIFVVMLVLNLASFTVVFMRGGQSGSGTTIARLIYGDALIGVLSMTSICMTTSIYALLVGRDHTLLTEVFA